MSVPVISYASFLLLRGYFKAHKKLKNQPKPKVVSNPILNIDYNNFNNFVTN